MHVKMGQFQLLLHINPRVLDIDPEHTLFQFLLTFQDLDIMHPHFQVT